MYAHFTGPEFLSSIGDLIVVFIQVSKGLNSAVNIGSLEMENVLVYCVVGFLTALGWWTAGKVTNHLDTHIEMQSGEVKKQARPHT